MWWLKGYRLGGPLSQGNGYLDDSDVDAAAAGAELWLLNLQMIDNI